MNVDCFRILILTLAVAMARRKVPPPRLAATLMQRVRPDRYSGTRLPMPEVNAFKPAGFTVVLPGKFIIFPGLTVIYLQIIYLVKNINIRYKILLLCNQSSNIMSFPNIVSES